MDGLAAVAGGRWQEAKYGFIDKTLAVEIDGRTKMGYIARTGKTIIEPEFDVAFDFIDGVAQVYFSEKVTSASGPVTRTGNGYIDKRGRFVWRTE